jgi:hypothetical protein
MADEVKNQCCHVPTYGREGEDLLGHVESRNFIRICAPAIAAGTEPSRTLPDAPRTPISKSLKKKVTEKLPRFGRGRRTNSKKESQSPLDTDPPAYIDSFRPLPELVEAGEWTVAQPEILPELPSSESVTDVRCRPYPLADTMAVLSDVSVPDNYAELEGSSCNYTWHGEPRPNNNSPGLYAARNADHTVQSGEDFYVPQRSWSSTDIDLFGDGSPDASNENLPVYQKDREGDPEISVCSSWMRPLSQNLVSPLSSTDDSLWMQNQSPSPIADSQSSPSADAHASHVAMQSQYQQLCTTMGSQDNEVITRPRVVNATEQSQLSNGSPVRFGPEVASFQQLPETLFERERIVNELRTGSRRFVLREMLILSTEYLLDQVSSDSKASSLPVYAGAEEVLQVGLKAVQRLLDGVVLTKVEDVFAFIIFTFASLRSLHDDDFNRHATNVSVDCVAIINRIERLTDKDLLLQWFEKWKPSSNGLAPTQLWEDPDRWLDEMRKFTGLEWPHCDKFPLLEGRERSHKLCFLLSTGKFDYVGGRAQPSLSGIKIECGGICMRVCLRLLMSKCF